jgi:hypothetical protein
MGNVLGWIAHAIDLFNQVRAWFADGLPWRKREQAAEPGPPSPTIPGPTGRFEFTRATVLDAPEWETVRNAIVQGTKVEPADDLGELMVGDMLTFRVEVMSDGRDPAHDWICARAICPRSDSVLAKIVSASPERGHGIVEGSQIEVPREAVAHVFRITAAGAAA